MQVMQPLQNGWTLRGNVIREGEQYRAHVITSDDRGHLRAEFIDLPRDYDTAHARMFREIADEVEHYDGKRPAFEIVAG